MEKLHGYMGKFLRIDLTEERITEETFDTTTLRKYLGGTGLGIKIMSDEVSPSVKWNDPENRLIWLTGILTGSRAPGSGVYTVATKGPLTNLFVASHSNGVFGARLRFAGFDGIIVQGTAKRWVYLYVHDGKAEIRDAENLVGKDSWETEDLLKEEVGISKASVSCIGPAGENLVYHACICNDKGHVCATNGCGAVMGSKKLKAVVVHGNDKVPVYDKDKYNEIIKQWAEEADSTMWGMVIPALGTNGQYSASHDMGVLAVKNYTTSIFPEHERFNGDALREYYSDGKKSACFACRFAHNRFCELKSGPHQGEIVEESEYEGTEAFSSMIGNTDVDWAMYLNNLNDRLGMDAKEQAFTLGLVFECYEKGLITKEDTDGLELNWGNAEAVEVLLRKIACREGFGEVLADGVMRAARKIGGEAPNFAVHTMKGNAPHVHDDRGIFNIAFSMAMSDMGSIPAGDMGDVGDLMDTLGGDFMDPEYARDPVWVSKSHAIMSRRGHFVDSIGTCSFTSGVPFTTLAAAVAAFAGWEDFTWQEAANIGERILNLMHVYNYDIGLRREHNRMSPRVYQTPTDGGAEGLELGAVWDIMVDSYYEEMGWDNMGRPRPETLKRLDLDECIPVMAKYADK